ncbi:NPP1 family protein [Halalkalibacterium halodurans]|uniref:Necrosis and ethylene inducing protein n=1 Tax=Halalkalibacterium halodurans (strain ATCC BAA-125 / DSM 18197 / FERM 7344 / JCM 9153 / C-125) TaxID=272558 RepID=Q9KFT2_HALH5|nr:NPP1 family protein [Halalkalibacterium halodurans]MDY7220888.1 NPP1 family protein [Halalkalibacterium halodurans]MDY7240127.1 NPP1 family protein [Halalkalibacterium halodurans]MED4082556.1 NPP1 family protein [Halalkalibacterium halodurans]MED4085801.1 NPP1 family protein [Halalkalibacterium halodurans]MED4105667.1 NPP1 family protein [Halalkalibacterium halodurans]
MMRFVIGFLLSILASISLVSPANAAVIDHDKVVGFEEVTPTTITQKVAKRFQPYLTVSTGCVPFPAVDADGNTSGGLAPTGPHNGGCSSHIGQVYSRSTWHNGVWAIMYAWYFPKDSPSPGLGHRHDWEGIVVWVDNPANPSPQLLSIAYSQHGNFYNVAPTDRNTREQRPLIRYSHAWPLNHSLWIHDQVGGTQPLIGWDDLTPAARHALNTTDFGAANVPFNDHNFINNLRKAWYR